MARVGLKLWSVNDKYQKWAVDLYEAGSCDYIEIYYVPGSLGSLPGWRKIDIPYVIHAPHYRGGLNLAIPSQGPQNLKIAKEAFEFADALNSQTVIFHPGIGGEEEETARQILAFRDPRTVVENKPYFDLDNSICVGYSPERIKYICEAADVGFCLDVGHAVCAANALQQDPIEYLKQFMRLNPRIFHLSDGDYLSSRDEHKHLGSGSYPLAEIVSLFSRDVTVTLETDKDSAEDLEDFRKDAQVFAGMARRHWSVSAYVKSRGIGLEALAKEVRAPEGYDFEIISRRDSEAVVSWRNSGDAGSYTVETRSMTVEDQDRFLEGYLERDRLDFVLKDKQGSEPVGVFSIKNIALRPELGKLIGNTRYRGKGLGAPATRGVLEFAFNRMGLADITARTQTDNQRNIALNQKLGFRIKGEETRAGKRYYVMYLTRQEFQNRGR